MKLNIGSGNKRIDGFMNMDVQTLPNVDIVHDLTQIPYPIESNTVEEIVSQETLEHLPFRKLHFILAEWYRILAFNGSITIQVPDIGLMCKYYAEDRICDCVPRKAEKYEDYKADKDCFKCAGRALIHPERWHYAFSGAQKHSWDAHLNHFTREYMEAQLEKAGFDNIIFEDNIYKIIVKATK